MADLGALVAPDRSNGAGGQSPGPQPRPLRKRQGLPNSRAVAGALLVAAAAVGLFAASIRAQAGPDHSYAVVRHAVAAGTRLQESDLALQRIDLPASLRARAFDKLSDLAGTTVLAPLAAGELVQPSALAVTRSADAARTVSFPIDHTHLGALKQGERIDILATYGTGVDAWTAIVVRQTQVVDVDRSKSSLGDSGSPVITVAVGDPNDEVALAHAVALAKLTVVVATGAPPASGPPPTYRAKVP
ncbi:MAG: SAF domain-containing protein [Acidimicrobiales bacterium]